MSRVVSSISLVPGWRHRSCCHEVAQPLDSHLEKPVSFSFSQFLRQAAFQFLEFLQVDLLSDLTKVYTVSSNRLSLVWSSFKYSLYCRLLCPEENHLQRFSPPMNESLKFSRTWVTSSAQWFSASLKVTFRTHCIFTGLFFQYLQMNLNMYTLM